MDLHERSLSVLACCYVNEVVIGKHYSRYPVWLESAEKLYVMAVVWYGPAYVPARTLQEGM
jgi:glycerol-3-phosphate cytidylyltransferase-like family protein